MSICELSWDSNFFSKKIAKIQLDGTEQIAVEDMINYDLVYIFLPVEYEQKYKNQIQQLKLEAADCKVLFSKDITKQISEEIDNDVKFINTESRELADLVLLSGWCSRFNLDCLLQDKYQALYLQWMRNYLDNGDKRTLGYFIDDNLAGMISFHLTDSACTIGLFAVSPDFQRRGIGRKLLSSVELYSRKKGITRCYVSTQKANIGALKTYSDCGYNILSETLIYHWWNKYE